MDIAPFGAVTKWSNGNASGIQVEWTERRDVHAVVVDYKDAASMPKTDQQRVEYWFSKWPNEYTGGWKELDDPWNGQWLPAKADVRTKGTSVIYRFRTLSKEENPKAEYLDFPYRRTLKVRLYVDGKMPEVDSFRVYGSSLWKETELSVEFGCTASERQDWNGRVEAVNGRVTSVSPLKAAQMTGPLSWKCETSGKPEGISLKVRYADNPERLNNDRGAVTIRASHRSFSFYVDDVVKEGSIYIRGIDAFVSSDGTRYADWRGPKTPHWEKTIKERVAQMPEQTMARAMEKMPPKPAQWVSLGLHAARQEMVVGPNGDFAAWAQSLKVPAKDSERRGWTGKYLTYTLATGAKPSFDPDKGRKVRRWLEEGSLPMIHTEWQTDGIAYLQSAIVTALDGEITDSAKRTGEEPVAYLSGIEITNAGPSEQDAVLWIEISPDKDYKVKPNGVLVLDKPSDGKDRPGLTPVRMQFVSGGRGEMGTTVLAKEQFDQAPPAKDQKPVESKRLFRYSVRLKPGEKHTVYIKAPYLELMDEKELAQFANLDFEKEAPKVLAHWKDALAREMQVDLPAKALNDFYRANLWHVLISTDKDPATGLYMAPAGTFKYNVYANETCMIARSLEMRGLHEEAARYIEPFFHYQGSQAFPGNFKTQDGILHSAAEYTAHGYNMDHGFILWTAAEHYRWTRDRKYIEDHLPQIIKACDWIINERQATKRLVHGMKVPEYGLVPAGQLEDVSEFMYWFATSGYYYKGLKEAAEVLGEIGSPEAPRLAREADEFARDIRAAADEMYARTPAVRLLDGTYVPYLPARVYARTHMVEGWVREGLYCALHLLDTGIYRPDEPEVDWILQDLEDNIFVHGECGYKLEPLEDHWFDWGGFNLQPNLLDNSIAYLRRDEIPNFLRAFFNTYAASIYPDTACFAEWVRFPGNPGGPLYKTPDECKFVQWMRQMLIREDGGTLYLAGGTPREWLKDGQTMSIRKAQTFFGEMGLEIRSQAKDRRITAHIDLPTRDPFEKAVLRLRHPDGAPIKRVTVNGAEWKDWDAQKEWIVLPGDLKTADVVADY